MRAVIVNALPCSFQCCGLSARALVVAGVLLGNACGPDFDPASLIKAARVIAVVAEPPEATPGQEVALVPIVASPTGSLVEGTGFSASWWRCPDADSDALGDFTQCTVPAERRELGGGSPYVDVVPVDLFGDLPGAGSAAVPTDATSSQKMLGALLGFWRIVGLTMDAPGDQGARIDSFKRVPVYLPFPLGDVDEGLRDLDVRVDASGILQPNTNPILTAVTIHEGAVDGPTIATIAKGDTYFFVPHIDERSLQDYASLKADLSGLDFSDPDSLGALDVDDLVHRFERQGRCEIPVFNWYVSAGELKREITLDESVINRVFDARGIACPPVEGEARVAEVQYTAPTGEEGDPLPDDGVVHGWVVLRDGRGGTAVRTFDLPLE